MAAPRQPPLGELPLVASGTRGRARRHCSARIWVVGLAALFTVPVGVGAAVYLEEFAKRDRWYNRLIEVNIQNLAAVPSIVFGILGLAFIVRGPLSLGPVVLAGALILTLLVLPTVIIASREAIRAVPPSIREGSLALGATEMQTVTRDRCCPQPSRASRLGSSSRCRVPSVKPRRCSSSARSRSSRSARPGSTVASAVLPVQIFQWLSRPQEEFRTLAAAAIVMLLVLLMLMNGIAIFVRNRYQKRW